MPYSANESIIVVTLNPFTDSRRPSFLVSYLSLRRSSGTECSTQANDSHAFYYTLRYAPYIINSPNSYATAARYLFQRFLKDKDKM